MVAVSHAEVDRQLARRPHLAVVRPRHHGRQVYRRRRLVAVLVVLAAVVVVFTIGRWLAQPPAAPTPAATPIADQSYVVQPGDTLWSIAAAVADGDDPRPVVDDLVARNGGGVLQVGQRLSLP